MEKAGLQYVRPELLGSRGAQGLVGYTAAYMAKHLVSDWSSSHAIRFAV